MKPIDIPVVAIGAGSQPVEEGDEPQFMPLPEAMETYRPPVLPETLMADACVEGRERLARVQTALDDWRPGSQAIAVELDGLSTEDREFVDQVLGEGEVSVIYRADSEARIQESILAGVWRIRRLGPDGSIYRDSIEVGAIPELVRTAAFAEAATKPDGNIDQVPADVVNARSVLFELVQAARCAREGDAAHVVNLTLLPQTEQDLDFIQERLGVGPITILSRGYGNCRITSTRVRNIWWVQYFNSMDTLILNTLEAVDVPSVASAAPEDIEDSAMRLREILEAL